MRVHLQVAISSIEVQASFLDESNVGMTTSSLPEDLSVLAAHVVLKRVRPAWHGERVFTCVEQHIRCQITNEAKL